MNHINQQQDIEKIMLATGNINRPYIVRDIVFAMNTIDFRHLMRQPIQMTFLQSLFNN